LALIKYESLSFNKDSKRDVKVNGPFGKHIGCEWEREQNGVIMRSVRFIKA